MPANSRFKCANIFSNIRSVGNLNIRDPDLQSLTYPWMSMEIAVHIHVYRFILMDAMDARWILVSMNYL